jgi:hypothetical protein
MHRPTSPLIATSLLAITGAVTTNAHAGQEARGTRLPALNVIRVVPSSTTSSAQTGVRIVNGKAIRISRGTTNEPVVPAQVTSSDRQARIAAARATSSPRGAVAASTPARRIVITSANASPVLREAVEAQSPPRAQQPISSLAQVGATSAAPDRAPSNAAKLDRGVIRMNNRGTAAPRSTRPAAAAGQRPQSMQSPAASERQITMSSFMVQQAQERKSSSMDMAAQRTVTRISAAGSLVPVASIRVVRAETVGN